MMDAEAPVSPHLLCWGSLRWPSASRAHPSQHYKSMAEAELDTTPSSVSPSGWEARGWQRPWHGPAPGGERSPQQRESRFSGAVGPGSPPASPGRRPRLPQYSRVNSRLWSLPLPPPQRGLSPVRLQGGCCCPVSPRGPLRASGTPSSKEPLALCSVPELKRLWHVSSALPAPCGGLRRQTAPPEASELRWSLLAAPLASPGGQSWAREAAVWPWGFARLRGVRSALHSCSLCGGVLILPSHSSFPNTSKRWGPALVRLCLSDVSAQVQTRPTGKPACGTALLALVREP